MVGGKLELVQLLLEARADVKGRRGDEVPLLLLAVGQEDACMVSLLMEAQADVDTGCLVLTCQDGNTQLAQMLLEAGADKDGIWEYVGLTPLLAACQNGHLGVVGLLVQSRADANKETWLGSPLVNACLKGHRELAGILLEARAPVDKDCCHPDGEWRLTPLVAAAGFGDEELARLLLEARADVLQATANGFGEPCQTPLLAACRGGHSELVLLLLSSGAENKKDETCYHLYTDRQPVGRLTTPLMAAIEEGHTNVVSVLLQAGVQPDGGRESPLLGACGLGRLEILQLLLAAAADVNRTDPGAPITPLIAACAMTDASHDVRTEMVRRLLQEKANANQDAGTTPLVMASLQGDLAIAKLLLLAGADRDTPASSSVLCCRESRCYTPLTAACWMGHIDVVCLLLQEKADAQGTCAGETPLVCACLGGYSGIAGLLLAAKAEADVEACIRVCSGSVLTSAHYTPLTAACKIPGGTEQNFGDLICGVSCKLLEWRFNYTRAMLMSYIGSPLLQWQHKQ